ncbi:MAG: SprT-like domain-containing protein [Chthoniobacteraceae bacterium]
MKVPRQLDFLARLLARDPRPVHALNHGKKKVRLAGDDAGLRQRCIELLRATRADALAERVQVRWSGRLRSTAGMAYPTRALIILNPRLREFGGEEIDRTMRHELAHLLAHHRAGRRRIQPHGLEWQKACVDLGLEGERRCHDLPLPRRTLERKHVYRCSHCGVALHRVRPLRTRAACLECCRRHNGGRYDDRFRLVRQKK